MQALKVIQFLEEKPDKKDDAYYDEFKQNLKVYISSYFGENLRDAD